MEAINGLAISGGMLRVVTLIGAVKAIEARLKLHVVSGSSSGAILAAMLACRWSVDEIADHIINRTCVVGDLLRQNPLKMSWIAIFWRLVKHRGIDDGSLLYDYLGRLFEKKGDNADITFLEIEVKYGCSLIVTASCYSDLRLHTFCPKTSPHVPVRSALRGSTAYTGIYLPADIGGMVYMDGGILCNYPLRLIDVFYPEFRDTSVGLQFDFSERNSVAHRWAAGKWPGFLDILANVASMLYYRIAYLDSLITYNHKSRTIMIPEAESGTVRADKLLHLEATKEEMEAMFDFGRRCAASSAVIIPLPQ